MGIQFFVESPVLDKVQKMNQRVCWQHPAIIQRNIDQTRLAFSGTAAADQAFSFLVVGDSGSGQHGTQNPQQQVAQLLLPHLQDCRFMLHTGDVVYLTGSQDYYQQNFIEPYCEFLVKDHPTARIPYDQMIFKVPILPVLGNHDYYDLPWSTRLLALLTLPIRKLFASRLDIDVGWRGSRQGDSYARAFLDYLKRFPSAEALAHHLDQHYTARTEEGRCLNYQVGAFTRLPNRYYTFRYGGIDFFALDSNTFNDPLPLPQDQKGDYYRASLTRQQQKLDQEKFKLIEEIARQELQATRDMDYLHDLHTKLAQIEESSVDIEKQLRATPASTAIDSSQLEWLRERLIRSWANPAVRGRILYFHHPPYVTETSKWQQGQTLAVRHRLREVLDAVAAEVETHGRPLVDIVFNGHAHCLESLQTLDTGHADSHISWIVCGGSGFSLRRQREEGRDLFETFDTESKQEQRLVARSQLFVGRAGQGFDKRRPYSGLRVDVLPGTPPKFILRPQVAERYHHQWQHSELAPFSIG
jgi:hypothetical protein